MSQEIKKAGSELESKWDGVSKKRKGKKNQAEQEEEGEQNAITLYHHLYFAPLTSAICYLFPAVTHTLVWADTPPHILV